MKDFAETFYKSGAWVSCRNNYFRKAKGLCERCAAKGIIRTGEIVHHKIILTPENIKNPDVTLNQDNLMLVCRDCHAALHKPEKRYKVDEFGRVTIRE